MMCFLACLRGRGGDVCTQAMCFSKIYPFTYLNFSWCNNGILSKDHTGNTPPTTAKTVPYLRVETLKNHTISGCTYLSSLNHESKPLPRGYIVHNNSLRTHKTQAEGSAYVSTAPAMKSSEIWLGRW